MSGGAGGPARCKRHAGLPSISHKANRIHLLCCGYRFLDDLFFILMVPWSNGSVYLMFTSCFMRII
jgi:hypothetical protein